MTLPVVRDIPLKGHIRLYSCATGAEDAADCFAFWMRGKSRDDPKLRRKCKVVKQFAEGQYVLPVQSPQVERKGEGNYQATALLNFIEPESSGAQIESINDVKK